VTDSKWLNYLGDIISGSLKVVRNVASGTGALVHCSDGWDRTPQITSLSSIILDPYYRTAHGFFILIEKEWCNMGHKFADRLNNSIKTDQEESPVFLQWLDCVWQVWRQCPVAFEFNEVMLLHLADQLYSGRWMHFTHNCNHEMEKEAALDAMSSAGSSASSPSFACAFLDLVKDTTRSSEVLNGMELKPQFRNDKYAPQLCDGVLFVSGHERSLQIWPYHFRWISSTIHSHLHPDPVTAELPSPSYLMNVFWNRYSLGRPMQSLTCRLHPRRPCKANGCKKRPRMAHLSGGTKQPTMCNLHLRISRLRLRAILTHRYVLCTGYRGLRF
jgi:hypothetical protein